MLTMEGPNDIHGDDTNNDNENAVEFPVVQEEKVSFSGDMPEEPLDIADEMEKIGKDIDPEYPKPLGED